MVAVNDGVIRQVGDSPELGKFVVLEDTYGNRYTYAELGEIVRDRRTVVMPTGEEQRIPLETQNLRPRLRALPSRAGDGKASSADDPHRQRHDRFRRLAAGRLEGDRRHRPGPGRRRCRRGRPAHQLLDPPGRQRRPADRPEADPRRLEAARGDRDLPGQRQEPLHRAAERRRRPAALQGGAAEAGPGRQRSLDLHLRPRRHRRRPDRPPRPGDARVPALEGLRRTDDHLALLRPRLPHHLRQRLRAHDRQTRSTSPPSTAFP